MAAFIPWRPRHKEDGRMAASTQPREVIFRKVRGILNKITPEKFRKLSDELLGLGLDSPCILKGVILLIFEKASEEPKYSTMYAQLCKKLSEELPDFDTNNQSDTSNPHISTFSRIILRKCQDEFENRRRAIEAFGDSPLSPEDEEARAMAKHKMLGNIKFICELGKQELANETILHGCIQHLCKKQKDEPFDENLECLCEIMKTIGCLLDTEEAKRLMDQYFERMEKYSKSREIPSRVRFMLQDVLELRSNKWVPRRVQREQNPKTIGQIRAEAAKDFGGYLPTLGNFYPQIPMPLRSQFGGLAHNPVLLNQMKPGQRALDDFCSSPLIPHRIGSTLGTGPGVINSDLLAGHYYQTHQKRINPMTPLPGQLMNIHGQASLSQMNALNNLPGHNTFMQYRGSHGSQENRRRDDKDRDKSNVSPSSQNAQRQSELPPRFQKKVMQPQGIVQPQRPLVNTTMDNRIVANKPLLPSSNFNSMDGNEISLRPAQNSIVLKPNLGLNKAKIGIGQQNSNLKLETQNAFMIMPGNKSNKISEIQTNVKNASNQTNKETIIRSTEEAVDDFISNRANIDDLIKKMIGLKIPKNFQSDVLVTIMRKTLDKSENERESSSKFLTQLKKGNVFVQNAFLSSFKSLLNQLSDMETDIPRVKSYVAGFIARAIVDDIISLKDVYDLVEGGQHYPLLLLCLQQLQHAKGQEWLVEVFNESKIDLIKTLPELDRKKERLADILRDRGLSFLYPLLRIEFDLTKQLNTGDCPPNLLYRWIKDNVEPELHNKGGFIQVLFTCIVKYVIDKAKQLASEATFNEGETSNMSTNVSEHEKALLSKYLSIFRAFLYEKYDLQLMVLYSLQSYWYELGYPKEMLLRWFMLLYDLEIIEDEVFIKWKEDINHDYPGKCKALFQVNKWCEWLARAEEDEEEGSDSAGK